MHPYNVTVTVGFGLPAPQPINLKNVLSPMYFWPKDVAGMPIDPNKYDERGRRKEPNAHA